MSKWAQLNEIKGVLAAIASTATVCILIGGALMDWRIGVKVTTGIAAALASEDLATDQKIINMDKATASNTAGVADNKDDITINRKNVERAFAVLMGQPVPDDD